MVVAAYQAFSRYYRAVAGGRAHFVLQAELLMQFMKIRDLPMDARILDAACGTGDVLEALHAAGYVNLWGADGSAAMLHEARKLNALSHVNLEHCAWEELASYFHRHGPFNVVFILGNALAHAAVESIPSIVAQVRAGVVSGGFFAFDVRDWATNTDGNLYQANRPVGQPRNLGLINVCGQYFYAQDSCRYADDRQVVTYTFFDNAESEEIEVSYSMFSAAQAQVFLEAAGFQYVTVERSDEWPYLVVSGMAP